VKIKFRNPNCESSWGFVFGGWKGAAASFKRSAPKLFTPSPLGQFNTKCFGIFGMVQHLFQGLAFQPQDATSPLSHEML
ncbi:hypothetical protein, partial [Pseudomonas sp. TAE6080]|uniref:hypothetical protein n=1 Tax=Pseudomonas sp. TAE6080 TaxID=2840374 RepID=UPI001C0057BA